MEDEAILALTEKLVLEKYGYKIITADSGEKAIEFFNKNNDIVSVLKERTAQSLITTNMRYIFTGVLIDEKYKDEV